MDFPKWRFWGQNRRRGGAVLTPTNSFLLLGVVTSVPLLEKIDRENVDGQTDGQMDTHCDRDSVYNLSLAICYS